MAAKEALITTLNRLRQANNNKIAIIVETSHKSIKSLISMLEDNKLIIVVKTYKSSCIVKVAPSVKIIESLPRFIHSKKSKLNEWATQMLPENRGHLLISTSKGILSHIEAEKLHLGGQILGVIY